MKKLLIAAAAMSVVAGAQAQSSVEVYGILDASYNSIKSTGSETAKVTNVGGADSDNGQGNLNGSRIGFRGTEDLGGGTKAGFVVEYGIKLTAPQQDNTTESAANTSANTAAATTGQALGNLRQGFVTLSNANVGTLAIGTQYTFIDATGGSLAPNVASGGTSTDEGAHKLLKFGQTARASNAIAYISPSFNGLTFRAALQPSETVQQASVTTKANKAESYAIDYAAGNLVAGIATLKVKDLSQDDMKVVSLLGANDVTVDNDNAAAGAKTTYTVYGAKYNFGFANIGLHHADYKNDAATKADVKSAHTMLSASVPLTAAFALNLGYTDGKIETGTTLAKAYDTTGVDVVGVYSLSKRTNVYALYTQSKFDAPTGTDYKQTRVGAGVRHSF